VICALRPRPDASSPSCSHSRQSAWLSCALLALVTLILDVQAAAEAAFLRSSLGSMKRKDALGDAKKAQEGEPVPLALAQRLAGPESRVQLALP